MADRIGTAGFVKTAVEICQAKRFGEVKKVTFTAAVRSTESRCRNSGSRHIAQCGRPAALLPPTMFGYPDLDNAGALL